MSWRGTGRTAAPSRSSRPAGRRAGAELEFLLVSTWPDAEAVLEKGGEITQPRGRLGASGLLRNARAQHYELMTDMSYEAPRSGEVVRLSSMALIQRRSSAFYDHVRRLRDEYVGDTGLVALHVGRRVGQEVEHAVVVSVWDTAEALEATASGGFVGGEEMRQFYATEPTIEQFTALSVAPPDPAQE